MHLLTKIYLMHSVQQLNISLKEHKYSLDTYFNYNKISSLAGVTFLKNPANTEDTMRKIKNLSRKKGHKQHDNMHTGDQ